MVETKYFESIAKSLWDSKNYGNALSRMYYAVLHCMCDTLKICHDIEIDVNHRIVHLKFIENVGGDIRIFRRWQRIREVVDYKRGIERGSNSFYEYSNEMLAMSIFIQKQRKQQLLWGSNNPGVE